MTSAPKSRSIRPQVGAAYIVPSSRTRTPASGPPDRLSFTVTSHSPLDVLDFEVLAHPPLPQLAPDPRPAVAAERRVRTHRTAAVDPHRAGPDLLGDAPGLDGVVAPDVRGQPVCGVVRQSDGLLGVLERQDP